MSETSGSCRNGSRGPSPKISSTTCANSRSRSSRLSGAFSWVRSSCTTLRIPATTSSRSRRSRFDRFKRSISWRWIRPLICWSVASCGPWVSRSTGASHGSERRWASPLVTSGGAPTALRTSLVTRPPLLRAAGGGAATAGPAAASARATSRTDEVRAQRLEVTGVGGPAIQDHGLAGIDRAADRHVVVAQRPGHLHAKGAMHVAQRDHIVARVAIDDDPDPVPDGLAGRSFQEGKTPLQVSQRREVESRDYEDPVCLGKRSEGARRKGGARIDDHVGVMLLDKMQNGPNLILRRHFGAIRVVGCRQQMDS